MSGWESDSAAPASALAEQRRAALGPVLPEGAEAESAGAWGDDGALPDEEWLREVPPHHG